MMNKPLVSIVTVTYNHSKYISDAIDSFLMQKTNFDIEIIIADDCSIDNNQEIIREYYKKYPKFLKPILRNVNIGPLQNFIDAFSKCTGKYVALCEGDDYWTDPDKLQKQVDFLEKNLDYNICFHKVQLFNQKEQNFSSDTITRQVEDTTNMSELAKGNYLHTPSVMLRNKVTLPDWFSRVPVGDWSLYMIAAEDKKIKKLSDTMAVYRVNENGLWSGKTRKERMNMTFNTFETVYKNLEIEPEAKKTLSKTISELKKAINLHRGGIYSLKYRVYNFYKNYLKFK